MYSSARLIVTQSEYAATLKRVRFWAGVVYGFVAVSLMLVGLYLHFVWFPEIQKLCMFFRDHAKPLGDDGFYGAMMGMLFGVTVSLPSMLLPLLPVAWTDRKLGVHCPQCGRSLTLWRQRADQVLKSGACGQCHATLFMVDDSHD